MESFPVGLYLAFVARVIEKYCSSWEDFKELSKLYPIKVCLAVCRRQWYQKCLYQRYPESLLQQHVGLIQIHCRQQSSQSLNFCLVCIPFFPLFLPHHKHWTAREVLAGLHYPISQVCRFLKWNKMMGVPPAFKSNTSNASFSFTENPALNVVLVFGTTNR